MLEKQDEVREDIVGEIREMRREMKSPLDERLIRIESKLPAP
jgi:hypothetical protein